MTSFVPLSKYRHKQGKIRTTPRSIRKPTIPAPSKPERSEKQIDDKTRSIHLKPQTLKKKNLPPC